MTRLKKKSISRILWGQKDKFLYNLLNFWERSGIMTFKLVWVLLD